MSDEIDRSGRDLTRLYGHRVLRPTADTVVVWAPPMPGLLDESGALSVGALVYAVDAAGSIISGFSVWPDWVVTTQVSIQLTDTLAGGTARVEGRLVRRGRRQVVVEGEVFIESTGGSDPRRVGWYCIDSAVLTPETPHDVEDMAVIGTEIERDPPLVVASVLGEFDPRTDASGIEVDVVGAARNPWGILHGAMSALLVEQAARAVAGSGNIVSIDMRFLSPVRVGPARASGRVTGRRGNQDHVRVELVDRGADDRLCVLALVVVD